MADVRARWTIYDYSTYNTTKVPYEGELRFFDTVIAGQIYPVSILGDGASMIEELPFLETLKISTSTNVATEDFRIEENRIDVYNSGGGNINVNLGTAGVPDNYVLGAGLRAGFLWKNSGWIPEWYNAIYVNDDNKVGIGTTNPSTLLHLYGEDARLRIQDDDDASSYFEIDDVRDITCRIDKHVSSGNSFIDIDSMPDDNTSNAFIRFFRFTNTVGDKKIQILKGDDTTTMHAQIGADGSDSYFQVGGGDFSILADNSNFCLGAGGASDFKMYFNGTHTYLESSGTIVLKMDGDTDDYIYIGTSSNTPYITTSGNCALQLKASNNYLLLGDGTTAPVVPSMTTTERNALTAVNGMIIYNTTDGEFQFREAGAWVSGSGLA